MTVELTVGMPMFRSKYIGWLAFEGLIRQEDVNFEWEIVAVEETNNSEVFGLDRIKEYEERLKGVGCVRINYTPLNEWIPLARKHRMIAEKADSRIYAGNADDFYPDPGRLVRHYEAFKEGCDFNILDRAVYYSINKDIAFVRHMAASHRLDDFEGRAVRTALHKKLPESNRKKGCDKWMYESYKASCLIEGHRIKIKVSSDGWQKSLTTFGFNNVSIDRVDLWPDDKDKEPYPVSEIEKNIPKEVMDRLRKSKEDMHLHKRSWGAD